MAKRRTLLAGYSVVGNKGYANHGQYPGPRDWMNNIVVPDNSERGFTVYDSGMPEHVLPAENKPVYPKEEDSSKK